MLVETGVVGGLFAAPADGLDLLDDVGHRQQLLGAGEELSGEVGPQAVADNGHVPVVHYAHQILYLVPAQKLGLVHDDAGVTPHLLLRHGLELGKVDARMGQAHAGGHEFGAVPLVQLRLHQQGLLAALLVVVAHHQGIGRLAGAHDPVTEV